MESVAFEMYSLLLFNFTGVPMIRSLILTAAGLLFAAHAAANDNLLSDVRIDSVFASHSDSTRVTGQKSPQRVRDVEELSRLLSRAEFETESSGDRTVKVRKKLDRWTFDVFVTISEDERHIEITFALSTVKDAGQVDAEKLLALMEISRKQVSSQFSFSRTGKRIELVSQLDNDSVTAQILRDEINRLAVLAKENESVWRIGSEVPTGNVAETRGKTVPVETGNTLTGNWSAARSATEAFALRFNEDGTFVLVYVKSGKQTRSNGKFTQDGTSLALVGDRGLKLSGKLTVESQTRFQFQPNGSAALTFRKAAN